MKMKVKARAKDEEGDGDYDERKCANNAMKMALTQNIALCSTQFTPIHMKKSRSDRPVGPLSIVKL